MDWIRIGIGSAFMCIASLCATVVAQPTSRVSVDSSGVEGNDWSRSPSISSDGRFVSFTSSAHNLVPVFAPHDQIYVHDRQTGAIERVSVDSAGVTGDYDCRTSSISADGRYVAFDSKARNLVPGDTNGHWDIFVHDRQTGVTERVSVDSAGTEGEFNSDYPSISADGRYVAFESFASNLVPGDTNGKLDIFVHDRLARVTERVSVDSAGVEGNGSSRFPSISGDGRYIAFESEAYNLVPGDCFYCPDDVFVHDRLTGATTRVSVDSTGVEGFWGSGKASISADGRYVAFESYARNLVPGDTNGTEDVFVHDRQTGVTERVSVGSSGAEGNYASLYPSISSDGRYVAFVSGATNLVPGDTNGFGDIFVHDRQIGATTRASVDSAGAEGNGNIWIQFWAISSDGRYVAFDSEATNLVPGDTNGHYDVFVRDRIDLAFHGTPQSGNPVHFTVLNALGETGNSALVLLSCSGITPGFQLPAGDGRTVYLNLDACTSLGLSFGALLQGVVDASGSATTPPIPFPQVNPGITISAAALTFAGGSFVAITSPISFVTQ